MTKLTLIQYIISKYPSMYNSFHPSSNVFDSLHLQLVSRVTLCFASENSGVCPKFIFMWMRTNCFIVLDNNIDPGPLWCGGIIVAPAPPDIQNKYYYISIVILFLMLPFLALQLWCSISLLYVCQCFGKYSSHLGYLQKGRLKICL